MEVTAGLLKVIVILLILIISSGNAGGAFGVSDSTDLIGSFCNAACNGSFEDKRGIPSGANPLHNRFQTTSSNASRERASQDVRNKEEQDETSLFHVSEDTGRDKTAVKVLVEVKNANQEPGNENTCRVLAKASSFHSRIYSEVEEIGWEHLVSLGDDLTFLSFRVIDKKERVHVLELTLDQNYPKFPPSVSADVPHIFNIKWSIDSKLKDVVVQFQQHLEKLQDFWSTLDDIDRNLWVAVPEHLHSSISYRQINIGDDCSIMLSLNAKDPRALPECRFLGSDAKVNLLRKKWKINFKRWIKDNAFTDNLANILDIQFPQPPNGQKNDHQIECGVCYAQYLPLDDELGPKSGSGTDYICENSKCSRAFHSVCLGDWLLSITTTRQSFDVLFGNCPYCSNPVAVRITSAK